MILNEEGRFPAFRAFRTILSWRFTSIRQRGLRLMWMYPGDVLIDDQLMPPFGLIRAEVAVGPSLNHFDRRAVRGGDRGS